MMYSTDDLKSPAHFDTVSLNFPATPHSQHQFQPHHPLRPRHDRHDEEDEEEGSVTDVDSETERHIRLSLVEEGDYMHSRPMRRRRSSSSRGGFLAAMKEHRWLIDTGLLAMIIFLLLFRPQRGREHFWEGAGDLTGFAPEFSQKIVTFTPDPGFMPENASEFFTDATKNKWIDLVPPGLGYVNIVDPGRYDNLPTKLNDYEDDDYVATTSMTHQLHCLHSIAEAYSSLRLDNPKPLSAEQIWHVGHCFDYLRQSLMCCGDVALEGQQTTFPGNPELTGSDGWDAKHVCKDYGEMYEHLKTSAVNQRKWISK